MKPHADSKGASLSCAMLSVCTRSSLGCHMGHIATVVQATGGGTAAMRAPEPPPAPGTPGRRFPVPPGLASLNNQTIRMIARTSIGGSSVRIRLSSALGSGMVTIGSAHIGIRAEASAVVLRHRSRLTPSA
jgi:hypothetical protein